MVLAAGLGSRLAPLTDHCPKPLLEVGERSLLARALDELCKTTVTQVVINIHHLGSQIETYLETQAPWPFSITLSREPVLLETAGGIINALPALTSPFYVLAGDVLCDLPLKTLRAQQTICAISLKCQWHLDRRLPARQSISSSNSLLMTRRFCRKFESSRVGTSAVPEQPT